MNIVITGSLGNIGKPLAIDLIKKGTLSPLLQAKLNNKLFLMVSKTKLLHFNLLPKRTNSSI